MHRQISSLNSRKDGPQIDYGFRDKINLSAIENSKAKGQSFNPKHIHSVNDASLSVVVVMYRRSERLPIKHIGTGE